MTGVSDDDHSEIRRAVEARKLCGGRIAWPLKRGFMRHPATIRERMAEDIDPPAPGRDSRQGAITVLLGLGWTQEQIEQYAEPLLMSRFGPRPGTPA